MKIPQPGAEAGGAQHSGAAGKEIIADLKARLYRFPHTSRTRKADTYLHYAENHAHAAQKYCALVTAMIERGLDDTPLEPPREPTYVQRLRMGLESGTFKPANAAALLVDLDRARSGDRKAKERVIRYLESPGVLEALDDG